MTQPPTTRYFLVDAFTDRPFAGNPAAVIPLAQWREVAWLQNVAREMNQSETAFLVPTSAGFDLRWFTPAVEVDLCGHATLASALVLWHLESVSPDAGIAFSTRSGILRARRVGEQIELNFPLKPAQTAVAQDGLIAALGVEPVYVGSNGMDYLVEVESAQRVRQLRPDLTALSQVNCRGIIVTARSDEPPYDFVSRFFAPAVGINEDPVTGSAHCCLAAYWQKRLGKSSFLAFQASPRTGVLQVSIDGDRVRLAGHAVLVAAGELFA